MYVPFSQMPPHARIWIYQSDASFASSRESLAAGLRALCEQWMVHGSPLHCSFELLHDHFIVLAADESRAGASGCSIDSSVRALKAIQQSLGIDFFKRTMVAAWVDEHVQLIPRTEIARRILDKTLTPDTPTFNNLISSKGELATSWRIPIRESWVAALIPTDVVAG